MSKEQGRWSARKILLILLALPLLLHGVNALNTWYLKAQAEATFEAAVAALPAAQDAVFIMPSVQGLCYVPLERCLETVIDPKFQPKAIWPVLHMHCQDPSSPLCPQPLEAEPQEVKTSQAAGLLRTPIITTTYVINGEVSTLKVGYYSGGPLVLPVPILGLVLGYFTPTVVHGYYTCHKLYVPSFQEGKRRFTCGTRLN